ncbi:hypothetical protein [Novosphingobium resinovorum]
MHVSAIALLAGIATLAAVPVEVDLIRSRFRAPKDVVPAAKK